MEIIFLLALALAPGLAVVMFIYLKDVYEPEPIRVLIKSFGYGVLSLLIAYMVILFLEDQLRLDYSLTQNQAIRAFVLVGFFEEGAKFLFLRFLLYYNKNFDEPFDGIVYAVMVGMGFAMFENIFYVMEGGGGTAVIRMFTAIPAHASFAVIMGFFLGEASLLHTNVFKFSLLALFIPVLLHGFYDFFLFTSFVPGLWIGALISLVIALILSRKAITIHQNASPFKEENNEE